MEQSDKEDFPALTLAGERRLGVVVVAPVAAGPERHLPGGLRILDMSVVALSLRKAEDKLDNSETFPGLDSKAAAIAGESSPLRSEFPSLAQSDCPHGLGTLPQGFGTLVQGGAPVLLCLGSSPWKAPLLLFGLEGAWKESGIPGGWTFEFSVAQLPAVVNKLEISSARPDQCDAAESLPRSDWYERVVGD